MLILILIDVQYLQNVVFSFEKGLDGQNYPSSSSHYLIKKKKTSKISYSPPSLNAIWKTLSKLHDFSITI